MARARSNRPKDCPYVGKGGLKLAYALDRLELEVAGAVAADLGCHVGGFTDCLLQRGAARVYAVDTGYGILAWKLRTDPRVVVCERTNALHWRPPEPLQLVYSDLGWTRQELALAAIAGMLAPGGHALSLVKPQYELGARPPRGVVAPEQVPEVLERVRAACPPELEIAHLLESPYRGSGGNPEFWLHAVRR